MRVGIFVSPSDPGGQSFQMAVLYGLSQIETDHELIILADNPSDAFGPGIQIHPLSDLRTPDGYRSRLWEGMARRSSLIALLRRVYQRLHPVRESLLDRAVRTFNLDLIWSISAILPGTRYPFIATVWDLQHRLQPWFPEVSYAGWTWDAREVTYRSGLPRATRVITGTAAGKEEIRQFYGVAEANIRVIPFPVPAYVDQVAAASDIRQRLDLPGRFLFYPAQFWPHKNHVNLVKALRILGDRGHADLNLVLTGIDKGNRCHVETAAVAEGVAGRVLFPGLVAQADIVALYRTAEALVFPSFFGPDNLPPLEAFALGCPVAAARVQGAEEQLGDAALLFDPASAAAIADAVERILSDVELRQGMIERGHARAARLTSLHYARRVIDTLDEFAPIRACWGREFVKGQD